MQITLPWNDQPQVGFSRAEMEARKHTENL